MSGTDTTPDASGHDPKTSSCEDSGAPSTCSHENNDADRSGTVTMSGRTSKRSTGISLGNICKSLAFVLALSVSTDGIPIGCNKDRLTKRRSLGRIACPAPDGERRLSFNEKPEVYRHKVPFMRPYVSRKTKREPSERPPPHISEAMAIAYAKHFLQPGDDPVPDVVYFSKDGNKVKVDCSRKESVDGNGCLLYTSPSPRDRG